MTPPRTCIGCRRRPVATPFYRHCFECMPGGPIVAPPCRKCGSTRDYYSAGLCQRCHRFAPQVVDSCLDCHGWGVTRHHSWLCEGCRGWRKRFPLLAPCPSCRRVIGLNADGFCRLCWRQAAAERQRERGISVLEANQYGQQLFLVDLFREKRRPVESIPVSSPQLRDYPVDYRQLSLLALPRELVHAREAGFADPPDPELALMLDEAAIEHARRHGWSKTRQVDARRGIRILLALQDTPGAPIKASEIAQLAQLSISVQPILDILTAAGMLDDDRQPSILGWFDRQLDGIPEQMNSELKLWFEVLRAGTTTPPRFRPRADRTVRLRIRYAMPAVRTWVAAGHHSLREITRDHIRQALPETGSRRSLVGQALRSLFQVLKAHRIIFANPTTHFRTGKPETRIPVPMAVTGLRDALKSDNPARAMIAGLVGFHALRSGQLRTLMLTDVRDGRLHLADRTILLAPPVRDRMAAWLDYRSHRWPATINPHLLINQSSAVRTGPVSAPWINTTLGMPSQAIREDRILYEAITTDGDVRRLCDLFGLSVKGAQRYTDTLHHPAFDAEHVDAT
ncbi:Site-specific recombinase XerD [Nocardia africana]|uniref:Site-specific recombinase XerD n=1 Tax=Nocardia africana TaxID=134964 RepID=A0A378X3B1_9NOCA|nr:Site-specific recombinase XerD [Nocardia africana]